MCPERKDTAAYKRDTRAQRERCVDMGEWMALALAFPSLRLWATDNEGVQARREKREQRAAHQKL